MCTGSDKFKQYLVNKGLRSKGAAKLLDVSADHILKLCRSERLPSLHLALKIQKMTKGKVKPGDWINLSK